MTTCARCRAEVSDASHCPRCGQAVLSPQSTPQFRPSTAAPEPDGDWQTDTAERPAVRSPVEPAPAATPPAPARYPLFADEVGGSDTAVHASVEPPVGPPVGGGAHAMARSYDESDRRPRAAAPGWLLWVALALVLVLVAAGGARLLLSPGGDDSAANTTPPARSRAATDETPSASASGPRPTPEPSPTPSDTPSETPSTTAPAGEPVDVAGQAVAQAPQTAPPNQDLAGNRTTYVAANLVDARPDTCWRMPGDGAGTELRFTLAGPTTLTRVGLVNGYAKTALAAGRKLNWYIGNRRVLAATWVFDDGTTADQPLTATKKMQTIDIPPVVTSTVRLRLVSVSAPGTGRSARDYTAVSEVTLIGTPSS